MLNPIRTGLPVPLRPLVLACLAAAQLAAVQVRAEIRAETGVNGREAASAAKPPDAKAPETSPVEIPPPDTQQESDPRPEDQFRFYEPEIYRELVAGRDLILNRRYGEARQRFEQYDAQNPNRILGPLGVCIALTAEYLETKSEDTLATLRGAVKAATLRMDRPPPPDPYVPGWRFQRAFVRGIEALLEFWDGNPFAAYRRAQAALSELERARKLEPGFADPDLGFGLYEYVVSDRLRRFLFFLPDRRPEGIAMVRRAAESGPFTRPIAQIALLWLYRKEKRYDDVEAIGAELEQHYPDNVISLVLRGQSRLDLNDTAGALRHYERIISIAPEFVKGRFYRGRARFDLRDYAGAETDLAAWVASAPVDRRRLADGHAMLGQIHEIYGQPELAREHYLAALAAWPRHADAAKRLKKLE
ncbi:MAG: tetratricopeptide repeat protein [Deltaproteobacteria bacterium]|nr:tetratricopeptide repeat protein [Deltaproteobacteria bacterium]